MGTNSRNREADLAMNAMKHDVMLEENTYEMSLENLPPDDHADPHGKILAYSPHIGWRCIHISEVKYNIDAYLCTHYTFTPPHPPLPKPGEQL